MKNTFIKCLTIVTAALLATSCSKDDNNDAIVNIEQPATEQSAKAVEDDDNYVTVPFSVKVDDGTSISKISYKEEDGVIGKVLARQFEAADAEKIKLHLSGDGIKPIDLAMESTESAGEAAYYFEGRIEVKSGKMEDFKSGKISLIGAFSTAPEETPITQSTESLEHLATNCAHVYKASFASNADEIKFTDQNAYIAVSMPTRKNQTVSISTNGTATDYTLNSDGKIWIAVDAGSRIKSTDIALNSKIAEAGHIYNINVVAVTGIILNQSEITLQVGNNYEYLEVSSFAPENCRIQKVDWSYDNPDVIYFSGKGDNYANVRPKAAGTATITATAKDGSGVTATCTVTVTASESE
ncbi:MAG: Ig-like domain-containing protein [Bacteroidales bacterium]|nr:Ig-like domain-containing protein [Bacteroidales bacterium]